MWWPWWKNWEYVIFLGWNCDVCGAEKTGTYEPWSVPAQRDLAHRGSAQQRWIWDSGSVRWRKGDCSVTCFDHGHIHSLDSWTRFFSSSTALVVSSMSQDIAPLCRLKLLCSWRWGGTVFWLFLLVIVGLREVFNWLQHVIVILCCVSVYDSWS